MEPFLIHQIWQADTAQGQKANGGPEIQPKQHFQTIREKVAVDRFSGDERGETPV